MYLYIYNTIIYIYIIIYILYTPFYIPRHAPIVPMDVFPFFGCPLEWSQGHGRAAPLKLWQQWHHPFGPNASNAGHFVTSTFLFGGLLTVYFSKCDIYDISAKVC